MDNRWTPNGHTDDPKKTQCSLHTTAGKSINILGLWGLYGPADSL